MAQPLPTHVNQQGRPVVGVNGGSAEFSTGMCDCCAAPGGGSLCCITFWCACITGGRNNEWLQGPAGFVGGCLTYGLTWVFFVLLGTPIGHIAHFVDLGLTTLAFIAQFLCTFMHAEKTMRNIHPNMQINCCKSCLKAWFCATCYLCQIRREQIIKDRLVPMGGITTQYTVPNQTVVVQQTNPMTPVPAPHSTVVHHQVVHQPQPVVVQQTQPVVHQVVQQIQPQPVLIEPQPIIQPPVVVVEQPPVQYVQQQQMYPNFQG